MGTGPLVFAVPFREPPRYNPRRRTAGGGGAPHHHHHPHHFSHHPILPHLNCMASDPLSLEMPPSPSPSNRSLPPFSSASSSLSETSSGSTQPSVEDSASYVTGRGCDATITTRGISVRSRTLGLILWGPFMIPWQVQILLSEFNTVKLSPALD